MCSCQRARSLSPDDVVFYLFFQKQQLVALLRDCHADMRLNDKDGYDAFYTPPHWADTLQLWYSWSLSQTEKKRQVLGRPHTRHGASAAPCAAICRHPWHSNERHPLFYFMTFTNPCSPLTTIVTVHIFLY